jgi:hypothetical protein
LRPRRPPRPVLPPGSAGAPKAKRRPWCCGPRAAMIGRLRTGRESQAFKASGWLPSRPRSTERRLLVH